MPLKEKQVIQFVFPEKINIHVHLDGYDHLTPKINELLKFTIDNNLKLNKMANELETLTTEVSETNTVMESAIVLIKGIKAALDAAGTDKAKLAELSASLDSKNQELAQAIVENTPAEEGGEEETPPE